MGSGGPFSEENAEGQPLHTENTGEAEAELMDCFSVAAAIRNTQHLIFRGILCSVFLIQHAFETKENKQKLLRH